MAVRRVVAIPSEANRLLLTDYYLAYSTQQLTLSDILLKASRS